jgi:hypothetical protein
MSRKMLWTAGCVVAAACVGLYFSRGPWMAYRDQKQIADAATREILKAEQEKADLLREKAKYDSPMGREELARGRDYVKKGEENLR